MFYNTAEVLTSGREVSLVHDERIVDSRGWGHGRGLRIWREAHPMEDFIAGFQYEILIIALLHHVAEFVQRNVCDAHHTSRHIRTHPGGGFLLERLVLSLKSVRMNDGAEPRLRVAEVVGALPEAFLGVLQEPLHDALMRVVYLGNLVRLCQGGSPG